MARIVRTLPMFKGLPLNAEIPHGRCRCGWCNGRCERSVTGFDRSQACESCIAGRHVAGRGPECSTVERVRVTTWKP